MDTLIHVPVNGTTTPHALTVVVNNAPAVQSKPFIEANTIESSLQEIRQRHIIPVFSKDNEQLISQVDFIELAEEVTGDVFRAERILSPVVRLSHPIMGRVPEARNKPASELNVWEKTIYYERMAFILEIPSISDSIDGQQLSLTIGGIKAYNLDNLNSRKGTDEHFTLFIGFKVKVCTNLCVWTDGLSSAIRVANLEQLRLALYQLLQSFDAITQLKRMEMLQSYGLTEQQFAQLIGRCRMYPFLPAQQKRDIPALEFGDAHLNAVCKDYYKDQSFCRDAYGDINLWRLYNLFTAANKSSYIDSFASRAANASSFVSTLASALEHKHGNWFLS